MFNDIDYKSVCQVRDDATVRQLGGLEALAGPQGAGQGPCQRFHGGAHHLHEAPAGVRRHICQERAHEGVHQGRLSEKRQVRLVRLLQEVGESKSH